VPAARETPCHVAQHAYAAEIDVDVIEGKEWRAGHRCDSEGRKPREFT
jgi:hypothetical protein